MTAYQNIDRAVAGLKFGTSSRVMSRVAAEDIPLGYPLFSLKGEEDSIALLNNDEAVVLYDAVFVTGNSINVIVTRPGPNDTDVTTSVDVPFITDSPTTLIAIVAAVQAITGIDAAVTDTIEMTVNSDDGAAIVVTSVVTGGATQAGVTVTPVNSGNQVFRGVSMLTQTDPVPYISGEMVNIMYEGGIYVQTSTAVVANEPVFYGTDGLFGNTGTSVPNAIYNTNLSAAGLAIIIINKP